MKRLLRTSGLVIAFGLVNLAARDASAWPYDSPYDYDTCYYTCTDGNYYSSAYTTREDCCNSMVTPFSCPAGTVANHPGNAWGGGYHILDVC